VPGAGLKTTRESHGISYDQLDLYLHCSRQECSKLYPLGHFDVDYSRYVSYRGHYLPGLLFHLAFYGDWFRVQESLSPKVLICNRATNEMILLDSELRVYWRGSMIATVLGRCVRPDVVDPEQHATFHEVSSVHVPSATFGPFEEPGTKRIFRERWRSVPDHIWNSSTVASTYYYISRPELCPQGSVAFEPTYVFNTCSDSKRFFVYRRREVLQQPKDWSSHQTPLFVSERGHFKILRDDSLFHIPAGYRNGCSPGVDPGEMKAFCPPVHSASNAAGGQRK